MTEELYYKEITPSGFGIAIKLKGVLFSDQSKYQKVEILDSDSKLGRILTLDDLMMATEGDEYFYHEMIATGLGVGHFQEPGISGEKPLSHLRGGRGFRHHRGRGLRSLWPGHGAVRGLHRCPDPRGSGLPERLLRPALAEGKRLL